MKAVAFQKNLPATHPESLVDIEIQSPVCGPHDLLVEVQAISVNPVDAKIRQSANVAQNEWRIPGWDAVGRVRAMGDSVQGFSLGDRVFYAGAINRPGSNAQYQAVDARIVGRAPESWSDEDAASLPLTALTASETLFDRLNVQQVVPGAAHAILLIGAAGGVGSILIQLLRACTDLTVIATASRPETVAWVQALGAHYVVDHRQSLPEQIAALNIGAPAFVFSSVRTEHYLPDIERLIAPQGRIALIDDPAKMDIVPLKRKSLSVHWELMFTRSLYATEDMLQQQAILNRIAGMADKGEIRSTRTMTLGTICAENLRKAHALIENGQTIGKIVLAGWNATT